MKWQEGGGYRNRGTKPKGKWTHETEVEVRGLRGERKDGNQNSDVACYLTCQLCDVKL